MAKRRLPPLNTLRGFDAASRHLSFSLAAQELFITQGAVSRQIRELEEFLGTALFIRATRRVELTDAGKDYFFAIQHIFAELERATNRLNRKRKSKAVTLDILPTLATMWLMPRLEQFSEAHPDVDLRIITSIQPVDFGSDRADIAIRVGRLPGRSYPKANPRIELEMVVNWGGLQADALFPDVLMPVCTPNLLAGRPAIRSARSLIEYPLIHTSSRRYAWPDWLKAHGAEASSITTNPIEFGHFFMSLEAARRDLGIAIIPQIILAHYEHRLDLCSFKFNPINSAGEYYLLTHESGVDDPDIQAVRQWIMAEAEKVRPLADSKIDLITANAAS
jgi:LysR family glycine cleavage system transcriptional activator